MANLKAVMDSIDDLDDSIKELYSKKGDKFELTGVEGVKTAADVERITKTLNTEREAHKATKTKLASFGDLNPEEVHTKLDKFDELEAAAGGKLDETKINQLVESRLKTQMAPKDRELKKLQDENAALKADNETLKAGDKRRKIHDRIREVAVKNKLLETAVDDALLMAERSFDVDEEGNVTTKDGTDPESWLLELQPKRPHWWPPTQGSGAGGSGGGKGGFPNNPWSHEHWNSTEQGRIFREKGQPFAAKMAESAGTTIGGPKPDKK